MSKTNFSKVEKALEEGILKLTSEQLLLLADEASMGKGTKKQELPTPEMRGAFLMLMDREMLKLHKQDAALYKKIGFTRQNLRKLIANPALLTPQDWKKIKDVKERIEAYKKELAAKVPPVKDEDIVEQERIKHINKRFNTNEKWLPLH